jgi:hypothetical protein
MGAHKATVATSLAHKCNIRKVLYQLCPLLRRHRSSFAQLISRLQVEMSP